MEKWYLLLTSGHNIERDLKFFKNFWAHPDRYRSEPGCSLYAETVFFIKTLKLAQFGGQTL